MPISSKQTHTYFVDEAGDLALFDRKGRSLLEIPGVSRYFLVGVLYLPNPSLAEQKLSELRAQLLNDPYFKNVPSMQLAANKTAVYFHAKDDLPEVRREVFRLLPQLGGKVQVALRNKRVLVREAEALYRYGRKLAAQDVYDSLVSRLFRNLLHKADENQIIFARRGKAIRKEALEDSIRIAKQNFAARWGQYYDKPSEIRSAYPSDYAGLQIIDYYLWALQRLYELEEERFFLLLAKDFRLIMDLDDRRAKPYGEWYSDKNPLTLEKIKNPQTD